MGLFPFRQLALAKVLIVASGIAFASVSTAEAQDIDAWTAEHFRIAMQAHRQNNLEVAQKEYELILSRNPKFAEVYLNLGVLHHQQGKYRQAVKTLQEAVSLKPELFGAQVFLGIDKYMIQDFQGALGPLQKAVRLKPTDRQAGLFLALTYLALDQPMVAARQLRKTAEYFPKDVEVLYHLGQAYLEGMRQSLQVMENASGESALYYWALAIAAEQKNDPLKAIEHYLKNLALDPNIAELYLRLAINLRKVGIPDLATSALERYALLNPDLDLARISFDAAEDGLSLSERALREHKNTFLRLWEALPAIEPAGRWPNVADDFINRKLEARLVSSRDADLGTALKLYAKGDYRGAAEKIRVKVQNQTDDWILGYLLARAYFLSSDYDAAEKVLEGHLLPHRHLPSVALLRIEINSQQASRYFGLVVTKHPVSFRAKLLLGKSYEAAYKYEEAHAEYREALKLGPGRLEIHLAIGELYEKQLKWAAAIEEFKAELALAPDNASALAHLSHAYTEARDADQAIKVLDKLLERYPNDGQAYADLGKAWTLKGETARAIEAYERALLNDKTQESLHYRLYQLYEKIGKAALAQRHLAAFKAGEARKRKKFKKAARGSDQ